MINVGQRLHNKRLEKGITLEQAAKATKISARFLSAIERGDYQKLPSSAYAQGFVKNYAEYLGLPKREISAIFRREFDEEKIFRVLPEGLTRSNDFPLKRIRIQQTVIIVAIVILSIMGYLLFQYRFAIINPPLEVISPKKQQIIPKTITVSGKTDSNAVVTVNEKQASVGENGDFKTEITLFPGKAKIIIKATNRLGKETIQEIPVEVKE